MSTVIVTAKIKLHPSPEQAAVLQQSLSVLRDVQNFDASYTLSRISLIT